MTTRKNLPQRTRPKLEDPREEARRVVEDHTESMFRQLGGDPSMPGVFVLGMAIANSQVIMNAQAPLEVLREMALFLSKEVRKAELREELAQLEGL